MIVQFVTTNPAFSLDKGRVSLTSQHILLKFWFVSPQFVSFCHWGCQLALVHFPTPQSSVVKGNMHLKQEMSFNICWLQNWEFYLSSYFFQILWEIQYSQSLLTNRSPILFVSHKILSSIEAIYFTITSMNKAKLFSISYYRRRI